MYFKDFINEDKKLSKLYLSDRIFKECIDIIDLNNCDKKSIINIIKILCEYNEKLIDELADHKIYLGENLIKYLDKR